MRTVLFYCSLFISITSCSHENSQNLEWIPFSWVSDSVSGKYFEKAAIILPVTIDELPHKFSMQFDLGAINTVFYGNSLNPFLEKYSSLNNKLDTINTFWMQGQECPIFSNVDLMLGKVNFKNLDIGLYPNFGNEYFFDSISPETKIHIGTIGADIALNKILIIDFNSNKIAITDTLPSEYQNLSFENIKIDDGRIKIPFRINDKVEDLMFDTGASLFSLVTNKENALKIGGKEITDSLTVPSWDEIISFYGLETIVPIFLGSKQMGKSMVYYNDDPSWDDFYKSENIWGITGNAFFFDNVIIIDYKGNRFGIK